MEIEQEAGLREYLLAARRRWLLMVAVLFTVLVTVLLASLRMTPVYEAVTRVEVQPVLLTGGQGAALDALSTSDASLATQVELILSDAVLRRAAEDLRLGSASELRKGLEVARVGETRIVEIRTEYEVPEDARDRANAVATAYVDFRRDRAIEAVLAASQELDRRIEEARTTIVAAGRQRENAAGSASELESEKARLEDEVETLESRISAARPAPPNPGLLARIERARTRIGELERQIAELEGSEPDPQLERDVLIARLGALEAQRQALPEAETLQHGGGSVINPAATPTEPVRPHLGRNLLFAAALGIALAIGAAFLAEQLGDRVRDVAEVERAVGAPVLAHVPYIKHWEDGDGIAPALADPVSVGVEAFRTLRANLEHLSAAQPLRTLLVTSAVHEEGKTTAAANLAVVFAQAGRKTVAVSADLRRPSLHRLFGVNGSPARRKPRDPNVPLMRAVQLGMVENLTLLGEPTSTPNPTEVLASDRFADLLRSSSDSADLVVVDSPPVLGMADASVLAARVDGVLMVVNPQEVTRRALKHAAEQLRRAGGRIVGALMNGLERQDGYGYYYGYYYVHSNGDSPSPPADGKGRELSFELER